MKALDVDVDHDVWVAVPSEWTDDTWPDYRDWAREAAEAAWGGTPAVHDGFTVDDLALTLAMFVERFTPDQSSAWMFLWLPEPALDLLVVQVHLFEAEDDPETARRVLLGLDEPDSVEPPVVEDVHSPHLGAGHRSIRCFPLDPDGDEVPLAVGVRYAWRTDDSEVLLTLSTADRTAAFAALDDLDELARSVTLTDLGSDGT